jgi:predicted phosphodiesterase
LLIGLLSDAHGNALGLAAALGVLREAEVSEVYFLGDAVGYLPGEAEVLRLLEEAAVRCQRGNHEAMLLGELALDPARDEVYGLGAARGRLTPDLRSRLAGWPLSRELHLDGRRVLLVHGSPREPLTEYVYPDGDLEWLAALGYDAIFMGNTHRPFTTRRDGVLIANVGSCGLPRDQGDLAACAVYDSVAHECRVLRVRVPPDRVLAQFEDGVHPLVSRSLRRECQAPFGVVVR